MPRFIQACISCVCCSLQSNDIGLACLFLCAAGGLIGFVKSGSNKSLISGGGAALALFIVFAQLPAHPTFASSFGVGEYVVQLLHRATLPAHALQFDPPASFLERKLLLIHVVRFDLDD